jgi:hypothetical protein
MASENVDPLAGDSSQPEIPNSDLAAKVFSS